MLSQIYKPLSQTESMRPATLTYLGYSASDVCAQLAAYDNEVRVLYAIDALVTALAFMRMDTVAVLFELGTPLEMKGLLGITVREAAEAHSKSGGMVLQFETVANV